MHSVLLVGQGLAASAVHQCPEHLTGASTVLSLSCYACLDADIDSCGYCGAGHSRHKATWKLYLGGGPWVPLMLLVPNIGYLYYANGRAAT